jgi:hypothetical protein
LEMQESSIQSRLRMFPPSLCSTNLRILRRAYGGLRPIEDRSA